MAERWATCLACGWVGLNSDLPPDPDHPCGADRCPGCGTEGSICCCLRSETAARRRLASVVVALLLALALPVLAQAPPRPEPVEEPAEVEPADRPFALADYIAPSAWCPLRDDSEPDAFGCDAGLAVSLRSWRAGEGYGVEAVVFVGAETVGAGVAYCRGRLCVGVGVGAVRDEFGIDTGSAAPVVGATFSVGGLRE